MKKALSFVLVLVMLFSLSSCLLLEDGFLYEDRETAGGDNIFNVQGGDNNEINITVNGQNNVIAANKALLCTVSIYCDFTKKGSFGFGSGETYSSAGAGVIYRLNKERGEAYIITNYHVVHDAQSNTSNQISNSINVYLYGMEATKYAIPATYVGGSVNYDLAILKVEASEVLMKSAATAATIADSDNVMILDTVIAIGNPEGVGISATVGHVNVDSEYINISMTTSISTTTVELRCIRIDAAVNSGNSGGGLYNNKGELIGIVNAKMADSSVDNIGYAIPSNVARAIADNVIYYCDGTQRENVYRCILGINVAAVELSCEYDETTGNIIKKEVISVQEVQSGAPVSNTLERGDIINSITIDGKTHEVTRLYHVVDTMLDARVGSVVYFNITRDGTPRSIKIVITSSMLAAY